jgi:hypothetical protein
MPYYASDGTSKALPIAFNGWEPDALVGGGWRNAALSRHSCRRKNTFGFLSRTTEQCALAPAQGCCERLRRGGVSAAGWNYGATACETGAYTFKTLT